MPKTPKSPVNTSPPPMPPQQLSIALDSNRLLGLTAADRVKVLTNLAALLMQAAGIVLGENDDER